MAFLVCYSRTPPNDHTKDKAIYLEQGFYKLIFYQCRHEGSGYAVLRDIALLKYKSPTLIVGGDQLVILVDELAQLGTSSKGHSQIADFKTVCEKAIASGYALTISGDMYPELCD